MNLIPDNILHAICWTLLHSLWQGLILAVVAGIVMVLSKRAGSALRYNLLCGLLVIFIASITCTFYLQMQTPAPGGPSITNVAGASESVHGTEMIAGPAADVQKPISPFQTGIASFVRYFNTHASLVVLVWFIIFLGRFVTIAGGLVLVQRIRYYQTSPAPPECHLKLTEYLKRLQIGQPVMLLQSALIKIPVVVGFLKPTILIPIGMLTRLSPMQVESILIHELAHIRRRDYLFNLLQNLIDTFFFFNPALIWVSSLIRSERENCCDDIAIGETRSRKKFVEALVSFHAYSSSVQDYALSFAAKENQLVRRVKRIVYKKNHSLNPGERILLMGCLLVLSAAFMTIDQARPPALTQKTKIAPSLAGAPAPVTETGFSVPKVKQTGHHSHEETRNLRLADQAIKTSQLAAPDTTAPAPSPPGGLSPVFRFEDLSLDELVECREHGVTEEYIMAFEKMGYRDVSVDKFIELRDHGVTAEFIHDLNKLGYSSLTLTKAMQMRDHGATPEFIAGFLKLGFKNITVDMAIRLVDHGVNSGYIESFNKRTGAHLELDEYIHLRDAGIRAS